MTDSVPAVEQIEVANEIEPTFVILNPRDWWNMRRSKDTLGRYILGDPQAVGNPTLWDSATVSTTSMAPGTFLVGSGQSAAAEIRDRMEMQVEISTEHADSSPATWFRFVLRNGWRWWSCGRLRSSPARLATAPPSF